MQGRGDLSHFKRIYYVEVDRGTESTSVIQNKLIAYNLYYKSASEYFTQFGNTMKILFVCHKASRAETINKTLKVLEGSQYVWVSSGDQVNQESVLGQEIWTDIEGNKKAILK